MLKLLVLLSVVCLAYSFSFRTVQRVGAEGTVKCNGRPAKDVSITIYDHDTLSKDDKMAEGKTDSSGYFKLIGKTKEFSSIKPYVYIRNKKGDKNCRRTFKKDIPTNFITSGSPYPKNFFNLGTIELSAV